MEEHYVNACCPSGSIYVAHSVPAGVRGQKDLLNASVPSGYRSSLSQASLSSFSTVQLLLQNLCSLALPDHLLCSLGLSKHVVILMLVFTKSQGQLTLYSSAVLVHGAVRSSQTSSTFLFESSREGEQFLKT